MPARSDRTHDLVVYGATGFTGALVVDHLRDSADAAGLRWAVAGRNKAKLEQVLDDTGASADIVVADSSDPDSVRAMVADAQVVCATAGPYALYGTPVVEACAAEGTDYCDLTGEAQWMRRMIDAHGDAAAASGARIVHTAGFDSIPSDMGVVFTQQQMLERHGTYARQISGRLKAASGGFSGGTVASLLNYLDEADTDPEIAALRDDPYGLNPAGERSGPDGPERMTPGRDDVLESWNAPFVMAEINTRVVRRTNALTGYRWGRDFRYDEAVLTGSGPLGLAAAAALSGGTFLGQAAAAFGPTRALLKRVVPKPGTGPSPQAQAKGFWDLRFAATGPAGQQLVTKVTGQGDPGYRSTSRMLGETALALAAGEAIVDGGIWTPGSALGEGFIPRLEANAEVAFEVLD